MPLEVSTRGAVACRPPLSCRSPLDNEIRVVLAAAADRFPVHFARQADSTAVVLEELSRRGLDSALVVRADARADAAPGGNTSPSMPDGAAAPSAADLRLRDIVGFIDINTILQTLLRGARAEAAGLVARRVAWTVRRAAYG